MDLTEPWKHFLAWTVRILVNEKLNCQNPFRSWLALRPLGAGSSYLCCIFVSWWRWIFAPSYFAWWRRENGLNIWKCPTPVSPNSTYMLTVSSSPESVAKKYLSYHLIPEIVLTENTKDWSWDLLQLNLSLHHWAASSLPGLWIFPLQAPLLFCPEGKMLCLHWVVL